MACFVMFRFTSRRIRTNCRNQLNCHMDLSSYMTYSFIEFTSAWAVINLIFFYVVVRDTLVRYTSKTIYVTTYAEVCSSRCNRMFSKINCKLRMRDNYTNRPCFRPCPYNWYETNKHHWRKWMNELIEWIDWLIDWLKNGFLVNCFWRCIEVKKTILLFSYFMQCLSHAFSLNV